MDGVTLQRAKRIDSTTQGVTGSWPQSRGTRQLVVTYNDSKIKTYHSFEKDMPNGEVTALLPDGREYVGPIEDGHMNGRGTQRWTTGKFYVGDFCNGVLEGFGNLFYPNGDHFEGWFNNGNLSEGIFTFANGNVYKGGLINNKFNGKGTMTWANGNTYTGEFKDGQRTGYGIEYIAESGESFNGPFKNGLRHGRGTFTDATGDSLSIEYNEGKLVTPQVKDGKILPFQIVDKCDVTSTGIVVPYGNATVYWKATGCTLAGLGICYEHETKNMYLGQFLRSADGKLDIEYDSKCQQGVTYHGKCEFHGYGMYVFNSESGEGEVGDIYRGEFKNGSKHGKGRYEKEDGLVGVGEWVNNVIREGIRTWPNGDYLRGIFSNDTNCTGNGRKTKPDGSVYEGDVVDGKRHGTGKLIFGDDGCKGDEYHGEFKSGKRTGQGKYIWADKEDGIYEGTFNEGRLEGRGRKYWPNSTVMEGIFKDGRLVDGTLTFGNGVVHKGKFKDNQLISGTITVQNKLVYKGDLKNGKYDGFGTVYLPNGRVVSGEFKEGNYIGPGTN